MNLNQTVLLLHCGESVAISFTRELKNHLDDLSNNYHVIEYDCSSLSEVGESSDKTLKYHMQAFDIPVSQYDHELARPGLLEQECIPLTIFCLTPSSFESRVFRNSFVHHIDANGLVPGTNTIPVLFDTTYEEQKQQATGDQHLEYTMRRAYLAIKSTELVEIEDLIRAILNEIPEELKQRQQQRWRRLLGQCFTSVSFVSHQLSTIGLVLSLLILLLTTIIRRQEAAANSAEIVGMLAGFLIGLRLADIPARAAFVLFRNDAYLQYQKINRHMKGMVFPGAVFFLFAFIYGPHAIHSILVIFGFALGIVEQRYRYAVFQRRIRLAGADNYAQHMAGRILPILAQVAPSRIPKKMSFDFDCDWGEIWDIYAMRVMPSVSRTFFRPSPRVFISYRWADEDDQRDADIATRLSDLLIYGGNNPEITSSQAKPFYAKIPHFLDKRKLKRGLAFRSRIAIEISEATHFILLLSKRTVSGETCGDESRQALACLPISAWPRIIICPLDTDEEILAANGDPVFKYLLTRASRITQDELMNLDSLLPILKRTAPDSFLADFAKYMLPLSSRKKCQKLKR